jgi:L,D-transpeptidase ErfK/SrfK
MMERRSRSGPSAVLGAALAALALAGCVAPHGAPRGAARSGPLRHPLEAPPASRDLVGRLAFREARAEDTLIDLGPELGVGYTELVAANPGIDPWLPKEGTRLVVPNARLLPSGPREGIVVNLGDLRLYYFEPGLPPRSYPIGIAKDGFTTPLGETVVTAKREKPTWVPGESARREDPSLPHEIEPGPDNPLGEHALYLGWPTYLIHGTNDARGVGRHSSRGCIRLYPDDIAGLYARVAPGTRVRVIDEPVKIGWIGGELYLEVNPDAEQSFALDESGKAGAPRAPRDWRERIAAAVGERTALVDWPRAERAALRRSGVPTRITGGPPRPGELRPPPVVATPSSTAAGYSARPGDR